MGQGKVELSRSWKAGRVWMDRAQRKGQGEGWGQGPATAGTVRGPEMEEGKGSASRGRRDEAGGPESAGSASHGNQLRLSAEDQLTAAGS